METVDDELRRTASLLSTRSEATRRWHVLPIVLILASSAACASSGAVPAPFPRPGAPSLPVAGPPLDRSADLIGTAMSLRGAPYRNGGADPSGFDCSGFVAFVFGQHGVFVPRTTAEQFAATRRIDSRSLEAGDLVFFSTSAPGPSHVGIAISPEEFVHAPSASGVVRVERLGASYWASRFLGARRVR